MRSFSLSLSLSLFYIHNYLSFYFSAEEAESERRSVLSVPFTVLLSDLY